MTRDEFGRRIVLMQGSLYRVAYGMLFSQHDCADAIQESILRAWQKRDELKDDALFERWVTRILINECRDQIRRRGKLTFTDRLPDIAAPPGADPELHDALARLEEKLRLPTVLHYMEGYQIEEVARMLKCPTGTVKTRLRKAKEVLRGELDSTEGRVCHAEV